MTAALALALLGQLAGGASRTAWATGASADQPAASSSDTSAAGSTAAGSTAPGTTAAGTAPTGTAAAGTVPTGRTTTPAHDAGVFAQRLDKALDAALRLQHLPALIAALSAVNDNLHHDHAPRALGIAGYAALQLESFDLAAMLLERAAVQAPVADATRAWLFAWAARAHLEAERWDEAHVAATRALAVAGSGAAESALALPVPPSAVLPSAVLPSAVLPSAGLSSAGLPSEVLPSADPAPPGAGLTASAANHRVLHDARLLQARAAVRAGHEHAIPALERLLERYPEYPEARLALLDLATRLVADDRLDEAAALAERMASSWPWSPVTARVVALVRGAGLDTPLPAERSLETDVALGEQWRLARHWQVAGEHLERVLARAERDGAAAVAAEARYQLALNSYDRGAFDDALRWLDVLEQDPGAVRSQDRGLWRARTLSRLARPDDAIAVMEQVAAARGSTAGADLMFEFLWDLGRWDAAHGLLGSISRARRPAPFDLAFLDMMRGRCDLAEPAFARLSREGDEHSQLQAMYWLGRCLLKRGEVSEARGLFERVSARRPFDYYAIQARSRLAELDELGAVDQPGEAVQLPRNPSRVHWHGMGDARPAGFTVTGFGSGPVSAYAEELDARGSLARFTAQWGALFPDAQVALDLLELGSRTDALWVFRRVAGEYVGLISSGQRPGDGRPVGLSERRWAHRIDNRRQRAGWWGLPLDEPAYPTPAEAPARQQLAARQAAILDGGDALEQAMMDALRELNDHYMVRRLLFRHRGFDGGPMDGPGRLDWFEAYPRAYPELVIVETRALDINPYLLWSLVIVESDMNPDSVSVADAYGLMQVIPKTGELVAGLMGLRDFGIHSLIEPDASVRFGSWYLRELLVKFHQQEALAFVAYNAGPHQVARWLDWRGELMDADEFLETIPFRGARNYPKRILRYMATYQALYEGEARIYMGLGLERLYEDNIYF